MRRGKEIHAEYLGSSTRVELAKRKSGGGVDDVAEYKWPTELRRYPGNLSITFVTSIDVIAIDYHLLCVFFFREK